VKRRFTQLFAHEDKLYALADDGSAWRLLGDPLAGDWSQLPDLPEQFVEPSKPKTRPLTGNLK
jgi:hypothetical protein